MVSSPFPRERTKGQPDHGVVQLDKDFQIVDSNADTDDNGSD